MTDTGKQDSVRQPDMPDEASDDDSSEHYPDHIRERCEFNLTAGTQPERLDVYLTYAIRNATRTKVQRAISEGEVLVNGRANLKASYRIKPGDSIVCHVRRRPPLELIPEDIALDILFEDDHVLVINKPAGMVVHPGIGNRSGTLVNALLYHLGVREGRVVEREDEDEALIYQSDAVRPGIVHRLDKDTSGIMVISKQEYAHSILARQFERRISRREYVAIAWGHFDADKGSIEGNIGRSQRNRKLMAVHKRDGKPALTDYEVVERFEFLTMLRLRLQTGRTHQIRVHCAHLNHPLFGDHAYGGTTALYGPRTRNHRQRVANLLAMMPRQALHAKTLGFRHPKTGAMMEFDSELPDDFQQLLAALR